jgi:hypothetical protein
MQELKEVMQRIRQKKQDRKKVHVVYKDVLDQSQAYQKLLEELKALKVKKVQLEHALQEQCSKELEEVERLALDIKTDTQLLSDMALTLFMKGETIELTDENDSKYEPVFKVTFKKTG